ncbi:MAG: class I SAM-dependent methyltransferase [Actinomycetota bacterium]|nr:class I SAM-dependent methyltransferase [Actinomycetota bacterium]
MYETDVDPWGFTSRWYEQRKYALTMAVLPRAALGRVAEPGCSLGVLTQALARRADHVVAGDLVPAAVDLARERLTDAGLADRVSLRHWDLRDPWPEGPFDLVVLSEVVYYLDPGEARDLLDRAVAQLAPGGHLLAAHWRPVVPEYPMTGDQAQAIVRATAGLSPVACYLDDDLTLDLFVQGAARSVATVEGLR